MRNRTITLCLLGAVALGWAGVGWAVDLRTTKQLAEQGYAKAQFNLGLIYDIGKGIPQDHKAAVKWFRLAAEQGNARAQHNLGVACNIGKGVPQDYKAAVKWFRLAAEQGNALAQFGLGTMYDFGKGVPQDHKAAHMWANLGAASGQKNATKFRDLIVKLKLMTPAQISTAQRLATECAEKIRKKEKGCEGKY